jgi:hypothetical protein
MLEQVEMQGEPGRARVDRMGASTHPVLRVLATVALLAIGAVGLAPPAAAQAPRVTSADCARISARTLDRQVNMRAGQIMIACGQAAGGWPDPSLPRAVVSSNAAPTNIDVITGTETIPAVTQSESVVWTSDGTTIVVNYNDSRTAPNNYSGVSVSHDGGATFTRLNPSPFATGHGTNFGDPILVFNKKLNKWFAGDLVTGCGGQGIGLWTSADGTTWSPGACAHSGTDDDRESMWVDNNSASTFYGRMYVSWNNFAIASGILFVTHSDDGVTWSNPVPLFPQFIRNVQLTGSPDDGSVYLAAMFESNGGITSPRLNLMFYSTDGGNTWTPTIMGNPFAPVGDSVCSTNSYFAKIFPIWRHMGWGQPGAGANGIVHYAYAGRGVNQGDAGDIYYTRSTDHGATWSTPIVLNSDQALGGVQSQWMPSLSVTTAGTVQVAWYDRRNTTNGLNYEYRGRQSLDNGVTWQADSPISGVLIPQPAQPDPNVQSCYAGDYNYHTAFGTTQYATWTDGRVAVFGLPQQDVFFAKSPFATPGAGLSIASGSTVGKR